MRSRDDWDEAWDSQSHTASEYRQEISDLRDRIQSYLKRIEELHQQLHAANVDWIKAQDEIQTLRDRIKALRDG
jgi:uncharacterized coiled-coil DUF342 family protein